MGGTQDSHFTSLPTASGLYLHLAQQKSSACQAQISEIPSQNNKFPMGREGTTLSHLPFLVLKPVCEERSPVTSCRIWEHNTDILCSALVLTCNLNPDTQYNRSFFKALVNLQVPDTGGSI